MILFLLFLLAHIVQAAEISGFQLYVNQESPISIDPNVYLTTPPSKVPQETIQQFTLKTKTGIDVPVTLYDRASDCVMIVASALPASKEDMDIFARVFAHYDVVCFDYRWANRYEGFLSKAILTGAPVKKVLLDEIEELTTVVDFSLNKKQYHTVVGLGECYGCFHVAQLQSNAVKTAGSGPFTHIVLDSCWYSLHHFAQMICTDPFLPVSPQTGGAPRFLKLITDNYFCKNIVLGALFKLMTDVSIEPYLAAVNIPVLFIHGRNDLFVPLNHFEKIWNATDHTNRMALITPFSHSNNLKNKNIYRSVVSNFLKNF